MKKLFILSAFLFCGLTSIYAQSADSSGNKVLGVKIKGLKKPLYAVDGIKQNPQADFNITGLKSGNIEEVKVLKSEEAVKLYGLEAIDGAVLITTKLGKNKASNLELENKLKSLNLNERISTLRDISFTPKNTNQTDSAKNNVQLGLVFRGGRSYVDNPNEPVYVVDGDKVEKEFIKFLSPESIKSVSILKNNDATTLYGAQAINGVVIITTKKSLPKTIEKGIDKN